MKIAVCGCAGIGKSTLVPALAEALGVTAIAEHYAGLFAGQAAPRAMAQRFAKVLQHKHQLEDAAHAFVVDRCGVDLFNLWLARRLSALPRLTEQFMAACRRRAAGYDWLIFPPWGVLPMQPHDAADGRVRVQDPWVQLRNHAAILGLARLWVAPERILCLPGHPMDNQERVRWLMAHIGQQ